MSRGLRYFVGFLAAATIVIARRPDAVFHAQFFAEDGTLFFAAAHNHGWWRVLFIPYQGYLHLLPRLTAGIATLVPISRAPLVQNLVAVVVETLPVLLLISPICEKWGGIRFRYVLAALYLTLPNCTQVIGSITESQWILALVGFLIVSGTEPGSKASQVVYASLLALCGFTGPFCIFLLPFAGWMLFQERTTWRKVVIATIGSAAAVQASLIAATPRYEVAIGASLRSFLAILGSQVYAGTIIGPNNLGATVTAVIIAAIGLLAIIAFRCPQELRLLHLFAALVFLASLLSPTVAPTQGSTVWQSLAVSVGERYWFVPCLAVSWTAAYACVSKNQYAKSVAIFIVILMSAGIMRDFHQPPRRDFHFSAYVQSYKAASPNAEIIIPEAPEGWKVTLIRH